MVLTPYALSPTHLEIDMVQKDYYQILGVPETASAKEIKCAYRDLAKKHHPDAHPGDKVAEESFKEISEAYDMLSDPKKRGEYDQLRKISASGFQGAGGFGGFDFGNVGDIFRGRGKKGSAFDFDGVGGFGDLFGQFFARGGRAGRERYDSGREADIHAELDISFERAISGGKTRITVQRNEACATCGGSGTQPGAKGCPSCGGTGQTNATRTLEVHIPEGVEDGSKIRLRGQGQSGVGDGSPGDLIVLIRVEPHRFFERRGSEIHCEVPVDLVQATLGTKIQVRTVYGNKAVLTIPPGTQTGTSFRLAGMGLRRNGSAGDQFVKVKVLTPTDLTPREQELLEAFAEERRKSA